MASIRKEIFTKARPRDAWDALRDVGALHTRLAQLKQFAAKTE
jgi:hypothetical protein